VALKGQAALQGIAGNPKVAQIAAVMSIDPGAAAGLDEPGRPSQQPDIEQADGQYQARQPVGMAQVVLSRS
jgi:hypothetical protein